MFNEDAFTANTLVFRFFTGCKFSAFGLFLRRFTVFVQFPNTLITAVPPYFYFPANAAADTVFIEAEVMGFPFRMGSTEDFTRPAADDELGLYGMAFLFARIPFPLFFLGRSTGLSVTSAKTTSIPLSSNSAFLPGRLNAPLFTSVCSTHTIVSWTVASPASNSNARSF
jgi:hypothetical protein